MIHNCRCITMVYIWRREPKSKLGSLTAPRLSLCTLHDHTTAVVVHIILLTYYIHMTLQKKNILLIYFYQISFIV